VKSKERRHPVYHICCAAYLVALFVHFVWRPAASFRLPITHNFRPCTAAVLFFRSTALSAAQLSTSSVSYIALAVRALPDKQSSSSVYPPLDIDDRSLAAAVLLFWNSLPSSHVAVITVIFKAILENETF